MLIDVIAQTTISLCTYCPLGKLLLSAFAYLMTTPVVL